MISAGNQTVMGLEDFVDILSEKPEVRAIGLHIEGLSDIVLFEKAALKALSLNKSICRKNWNIKNRISTNLKSYRFLVGVQ